MPVFYFLICLFLLKYGNFIYDEYTLALRLESKLSDLWVGYAHTDSVGILPGEEMERAICTISVINRDCIPSGNTHIQNAKREWV